MKEPICFSLDWLPLRAGTEASGAVELVAVDVTDAGAQALSLSLCNLYVQVDEPDDRVLNVGNSNISTDDPQGFFNFPPPLGGDTAPLEVDLTQ